MARGVSSLWIFQGVSDVNIISRVCGDFVNSVNDFVKALGMDNIITEDYLKNTFGRN